MVSAFSCNSELIIKNQWLKLSQSVKKQSHTIASQPVHFNRLQGPYRRARAHQYMKYLEELYGYPVHKMHTIPGVGHNATAMFGSEVGLFELFGP